MLCNVCIVPIADVTTSLPQFIGARLEVSGISRPSALAVFRLLAARTCWASKIIGEPTHSIARCSRRSAQASFQCELRLLDYVRNYVLRRYDHDLILGDEEFVCSYLWYLLGQERWKVLQFDVGWYFVANPDLGATGHLLDIRVLQHNFFNNVVLFSGELDRPRRNRLFIVRWRIGN